MNLHSACFDFQKNNLKWSISSIIILFIYYPLEIIIFAYLFGKIFSQINDINKNFNKIAILFALIVVLYIFLESIIAIKDRIDSHYFPKMEHEIRLKLVDIIFTKMQINYDSINSGEFVSRLLKIPSFVSFFYERFNRWVLPFFVTVIGIIVFFFFLNPRMGGITFIVLSVYILIFYLICSSDVGKSQQREFKENKMLDDIDDTLTNSFSVITSGKISSETKRIHDIHNNFDVSLSGQMKNSALIRWSISILNIVVFGALVAAALYLYKKSYIDSSKTITFIVVLVFLVKHFRFLGPRVSEIFMFYGTLKENNDFVQKLINNTGVDGTLRDIPINGAIEFQNVSFTYPNSNKTSLKNISFKINPRDRVAIIGKSGSGKTSIIKLMLGFYKPLEGNIFYGNNDISKINREYLRNNISVVHQNVKLFNRTILENIAYGTNFTNKEIIKQLEQLNIMKAFHNLPFGLQSNVGKYGDNLSGGQKQIIYLLRCYFRSNPIIILDEPTSSIDQLHKAYVMQMIQELSKKSTIIIVSHDPTIFNNGFFNKKIRVDKGSLVYDS